MRLTFAIIGFLLLGAIWMGPLPELARSSFSAHMAMHMGVVAVASAFIALGIAGGRYDPVDRLPISFSPIAASVVELVVVWTWHAPALHHFARSSTFGLVLEQGMFLLAGLWLWIAAFGGGRASPAALVGSPIRHPQAASVGVPRQDAADRTEGIIGTRGRRAAGIVGLLLTSMHMTLLGALLALTPRPLYQHLGGMGDIGGIGGIVGIAGIGVLSPLEDQHLGGAIMLLVGGIAYLAGGLWLTAGLLRSSAVTGEPRDRDAAAGRSRPRGSLRPEPEGRL